MQNPQVDPSHKASLSHTHVSSCSLQCFKTHQSECEVGSERTNQAAGIPLAAAKNGHPLSPHVEVTESSAAKPDRREALNQMFTKYSDLRAKLRSIYEATQDPTSRPEGQFDDTRRFERRWSEEKGFNDGMALLQRQLESGAADSADLRTFAAFIVADTA